MKRLILAAALVLGLATPAAAEPTMITVRAISKDSKFIGTSMGGVEVRLYEGYGEKLLAEGRIEGATGDTDLLMTTPLVRRAPMATRGDAAFVAVLDIDKPTLVRLEATGPNKSPGAAAIQVTSMAWFLPGRGTTGDGWVVEFPGLAIQPVFAFLGKDHSKTKTGQISADVTLMCGCPLEPGGFWDSNKVEVIAWIAADGQPPRQVRLAYGGKPSFFTAEVGDLPANFTITVTAYDLRSGNTGVANMIPIRPPPKR